MGRTLTSSNWMNQDKSPLVWLNGKCLQGSPDNRVFTLSKMYYDKIPSSWTSPKDMKPGLPPAPPAPRPPGPGPGPHSGLGLLQILEVLFL